MRDQRKLSENGHCARLFAAYSVGAAGALALVWTLLANEALAILIFVGGALPAVLVFPANAVKGWEQLAESGRAEPSAVSRLRTNRLIWLGVSLLILVGGATGFAYGSVLAVLSAGWFAAASLAVAWTLNKLLRKREM